ncbi:MAG: thioredoxin reductase (NADPH) [Microgenomates group bacterium Gr01-1014_5]|nr:MAG: thioredoxin reductase (NADPH) [Microgenomates group bacterium Gr01-1014_5]
MTDNFIAPKPKTGAPYDTIIIGSGPAGLTAGIYTTRGALSTLILGGTKWGGQLMLTTEVENYPGFPEGIQGLELMEKFRSQAARFGAEIKLEDVESVDFSQRPFKVNAGNMGYEGKSVIIATGADTIWLGLESEQKLIGRGISSCAPCDAPFFREKRVVVVGGGDSAMEEAMVLTKYASEITIIHRRDAFRASDIMQKKVLANPKIKVIWNSEIVEIMGEMRVMGVKIKNNQTNEVAEMPIDGVFVAIGHSPMTNIFQGKIELDEKGYVKKMINAKWPMLNSLSSIEGVFVAGDVHDHHYKQAVTAAGFGCQAAMDCERWLESLKT